MGQTHSINSNNPIMNQYRQLSPSKPFMLVHFYGIQSFKTEPLPILLDAPVTYEQVVIQCAEHLSENLQRYFQTASERTIGPLLLPLFGLSAKDPSLQLWVADSQVFDSDHAHKEFYFRIKVRPPATERIPQGIFADYLFWQCADDFLSGRVWQQFGVENKINTVNSINFNTVHIFIASLQYRLHEVEPRDPHKMLHKPLKQVARLQNVQKKIRFWNVLRHFPKNMSPELKREYNLKKDWILRFISYLYMRKYIRQFFDLNGEQNVSDLRLMFVDSLLKEYVLSYGLEYFDAERIDNLDLPTVPVELIIRPFQDGCIPGLYFNKKLVARLQDILRVDIPESESNRSDQKCVITLELLNQRPLVLQMASRDLAQSFVSLLDLYYRLKVNYHFNLQDDPQRAPTLRVLNMLRSYGPMPEEAARRLLRSRKQNGQSQDVLQYLIYQDCEKFGLLHVLAARAGTYIFTEFVIRFRPEENESGFLFTVHESEDSDAMFERSDPRRVIVFLSTKLVNAHRIVPKEGELCGAMEILKDDDSENQYTYIPAETESRRKKTQDTADVPMLYREDQIKAETKTLIVQGKFSDVYIITQMEHERRAILKEVKSNVPAVQEAYRKGADRLMELREVCHFFIKVYGFMAKSPLRIILESMPEGRGSLLDRLRDRNGPPFTWLHVSSVLRQLALCLEFLGKSKLVYGSFCCAKILIMTEKDCAEDQQMIIRLGDPSVAMYLDTLPVTDRQNQERIAWVAPERFQDLTQHTLASEVFSLGTTLWEIISHGQRPNSRVPVAQFLNGGNPELPTDFLMATAAPVAERESPASQAGPKARDSVDNQDLQQGSDIEEYVLEAQHSDNSGTERAQTAQEGGGDGDQEQTAEENRSLTELKPAIAALIHECRLSEHDLRPSPADILRKADIVRKLMVKAIREDVSWQQSIILEQAIETGTVEDVERTRQLIQRLQMEMRLEQDKQERVKEKERLEEEVRRNISSSIHHSRLDFADSVKLGEGHFGVVLKAKLLPESETRQAEEHCQKEVVAVKRVNDESKPTELAQFLKEALCIYKLEHPNVVKVKGIVLKGRNNPYQLVLEYADGGSLEKYIRKNARRLGMRDFKLILKQLAIDVAKGMEYVCQRQNRVHGDLAARNVLLFSRDGQGNLPLTAKLCDFGLSHQLQRGFYDLRLGKVSLPAYLLPPESLRSWDRCEVKFTIETDVWSYGIFLWEIFSNKKPEDVLGKDPREILGKYEHRYRLPNPEYCSPKTYAVMTACWAERPEERPKFDELARQIADLTEQDMD